MDLQPHSVSLNSMVEVGALVETSLWCLHWFLSKGTSLACELFTGFDEEFIGLVLSEDLDECCIGRMAQIAMKSK